MTKAKRSTTAKVTPISAAASVHKITITQFERLRLLSVLAKADSEGDAMLRSGVLSSLRGDWGFKPITLKEDDFAAAFRFSLAEPERDYLETTLDQFFKGKLTTTGPSSMGGVQTQKMPADGSDVEILYPIFKKVRMAEEA